jgi:hypothetical protein
MGEALTFPPARAWSNRVSLSQAGHHEDQSLTEGYGYE